MGRYGFFLENAFVREIRRFWSVIIFVLELPGLLPVNREERARQRRKVPVPDSVPREIYSVPACPYASIAPSFFPDFSLLHLSPQTLLY